MKYIRTEDRVWLSEKIGYDESGHAYSKITDFYLDFTKKSIIAQADTIEELCDNGIIIDLNGKHTITYYLKEKKCWLMGDRKYISAFYGAIWTDKGLIYVAKMNDKGELELL